MEGGGRLADRVPARLSPAEGRKFAFTVGIAFAVLGSIVWWRGHLKVASVFGALAGLLLLGGLVVPGLMGPVQRAWMGLAHLISKVTTPIFMGVVYFLVITPTSLLMRLFGRVPMRKRTGATFWVARAPESSRSDLSRQF